MDSYENYKPSDIEWIGEVPQHWNSKKLKYLGDVFGGSTPDTGNPDYWNGDVIWVTPSDISKVAGKYIYDSQRKITQEGLENSGASLIGSDSIVLTTRAPIGNIVLAGLQLCTNQGCKSLTVRSGNSLFYYYQLLSLRNLLMALGVGTTFTELSTDSLKGLSLLSPPREEQTAIAQYLDGKTEQIDRLIANKRRLIELLDEEFMAIINQAVTKGINSNVKFNPSGIEWLGEIPEHWQVKKLKHISPNVMVGLVINPSTYFDSAGTVPMLTGRNVTPNIIRKDTANLITQESNEALKKTRLDEGDIVVVRVGYPGIAAVVKEDVAGANCASMMIIRKGDFNSDFLSYCFNSKVGKSQVEIVEYGAAQKQFNIGHAVQFLFPFPPIEEQRKIVEFVETETSKIGSTITKIENEIELLHEYRTALISEAVTGKIKVV